MKELVQAQRKYFLDGHTKSLKKRKEAIRKLYRLLLDNEQMLADAIYKDFKKSFMLTVENELSIPYGEINHMLRKMRTWASPKYAGTNIVNFLAASRVVRVPLGVSLVIGPWNYPYMLSLVPAISALAAGNTVILKPSEITANSSGALAKLINENFPRELFYVQEGGVEETTELLEQKFDKIFFTGSTEVGKIVMKAAAEHLSSVTLELGGKNPAIIMPDCNLKLTAKRLTWGKFHNNGMACVSPDQIYVHESIREDLIREIKKNITKIFGADPSQSPALPRMVSEKQYHRVLSLINSKKVVAGGRSDPEDLYIAPTVMDGVQAGDAVMQQEIFGPLMALISFTDLDKLLETLKYQPSPLMFYIFTRDVRKAKKLARDIPSGGAMINDVILQFVNMDTPFGGVGESGMGSYHGKAGFDAFSQQKTIIRKFNIFEPFIKYPPYHSIYLPIYRSVLGKSFRNLFRRPN